MRSCLVSSAPLRCSLCCAMPLRIGAVCLMASPLPLVSMNYGALPWPLVSIPPLRSLFIAFAHHLEAMPLHAVAMLGLPAHCHCVASLRHAVAGLCFSIAILLNAMRCLSLATPRLAWPLPFPSFAHCAVPLRFVVILLVATPSHRFEMECFASAEQLVAMLSRSRASSASHA